MKSFLLLTCLLANVTWSLATWQENVSKWSLESGMEDARRIKHSERLIGPLSRIVGGAIAPVRSHPYLAGLLIDVIGLPSPSACGGSLLSQTRVLTAAHCWNDGRFTAWRFTVVLGSPFLFHGGVRIPTFTIAVHPQYNPRTLNNDIAILYLPVHVSFSDAIRPIALPSASWRDVDFTGHWLQTAGYGRYSDLSTPTTNTMVRNIFLQAISMQQCRAIYGNAILDSNICTNGAGGVGICQGDSGGPLTYSFQGQDVLIGVSSFVARDGCELGFPSAFARVTSFIDWIHRHM